MFEDQKLYKTKPSQIMSLIDLITGNTGNQVAEEAHSKFGIDKNQMIALATVAAPLIISYLRKKSQNSDEAEKLNTALDKDHDGSILDHPTQASERQEEGGSILSHIFGGQKSEVENSLSQKTGISMSKIGPLLGMLAPVVMGYIGKQKRQNNVQSGGALSDLLGGILGQASNDAQTHPSNPLNDILGSVLGGGNSQTGGNPLNDILGSVLGGGNSQDQKGGLGGLLGSLLGGK